MANELKINISVNLRNPSSPATGQTPQSENVSVPLSLTQIAQGESSGVMTVPTTAGGTVLPVGSVTSLGYVLLINLDTTNFVQLGPTSAGAIVVFGKLLAGEAAIVRLDPSITLRLLANTASCAVQYYLFQA